jgi:hypothetical protein
MQRHDALFQAGAVVDIPQEHGEQIGVNRGRKSECRALGGRDAMTEAEGTGLTHEDIPRPVELSFSVSELCATLPPPTNPP